MTGLVLLLIGVLLGSAVFNLAVEIRDRRAWRRMFGSSRSRAYREAHTIPLPNQKAK